MLLVLFIIGVRVLASLASSSLGSVGQGLGAFFVSSNFSWMSNTLCPDQLFLSVLCYFGTPFMHYRYAGKMLIYVHYVDEVFIVSLLALFNVLTHTHTDRKSVV